MNATRQRDGIEGTIERPHVAAKADGERKRKRERRRKEEGLHSFICHQKQALSISAPLSLVHA